MGGSVGSGRAERVTPGQAGTTTFLFADMEGSTRLLQALGDAYAGVLDRYRELLRAAVAAGDGREIDAEGDGLFAAFPAAGGAIAAAAAAQRALAAEPWPEGVEVRARLGVHTGEAMVSGGDYVGIDVHRAARISDAAHGGQVLVSATTRPLVERSLPSGITLRDLGRHRLKDLSDSEQLAQLVIDGLHADFPPLRTLDATPNNLPTQLTSFVGREEEVARGVELLDDARMLTLTGPGGTGKTRLSLQVAARVADRFPDGVWFVPLAPISDPGLVAVTILQALGLQDTGPTVPRDRLLEAIRDRRLLLVLDNFEQIMPAAPLVAEILTTATNVKVVVTSRAALRVSGEQEFPVPPLGVPDPAHLPPLAALSQYAAVALFIDRAVAVKPDFAVTNENAPAVAEICARLDGLPLAVELAAARTKLLTPQAMLERLGRRLTLLSGGPRDLPQRQQTLRDAIAWSHDLLDDGGKRLFARLAVFVGGWTLEHAETVCGSELDVLGGLEELVDQSLVRQRENVAELRFLMLQTIREFAQEQLEESGEAEDIRRRHAEVFLALAEAAEPHLLGGQRRSWLDRLEREHDNFRAALAWAEEEGEAEVELRLAAALWRFWQIRGHLHEARARLEAALGRSEIDAFPAARAQALEAAGGIAYWQGEMEAAQSHYQACLTAHEKLGDPVATAWARYNLSFTYYLTQQPDRGRELLEQALEAFRAAGDRRGEASVLWGLAGIEETAGNIDRAWDLGRASLELFRTTDDRHGLGWALRGVGVIGSKQGKFADAYQDLTEALRRFQEDDDVTGIVILLGDLAALADAEGDVARARRLQGAADSLEAKTGTALTRVISEIDGWTTDPTAEAWAQGQAMTPEEAIAYALGEGD